MSANPEQQMGSNLSEGAGRTNVNAQVHRYQNKAPHTLSGRNSGTSSQNNQTRVQPPIVVFEESRSGSRNNLQREMFRSIDQQVSDRPSSGKKKQPVSAQKPLDKYNPYVQSNQVVAKNSRSVKAATSSGKRDDLNDSSSRELD
jgi:hypothetical protein